jgi:segregation and condensation protein A
MSNEETPSATAAWPDGEAPPRRDDALLGDPDLFRVDVGGFEGPLDLLLQLARTQKVDLTRISILALANQFLEYIAEARRLRLEVAADYLVMAAWLAYLKSRLLIPDAGASEEPPAEELAKRLAFRLQRLQAMRDAASKLFGRNLLGQDVFARGAPEAVMVEKRTTYADNLYDLLRAYTDRRKQTAVHQNYQVKRLPVWSIQEARQALTRLVGSMNDWGPLDGWIIRYLPEPHLRRTVTASSFTASLELAREGVLEIRQEYAFKPIYMRRKPVGTTPTLVAPAQ